MSTAPAPQTAAPFFLAGATRAELTTALAEIGVPERELRMRVGQLWHWIYHRGVREFSAMRNVARPVIDALGERFSLARPEIVAEQVSADGTRKWLLRMPPAYPGDKGAEIETVYIPETDRGTLCVSSQVGCTLNCTFCHTGTQAWARNLMGPRLSPRFWWRATGSAISPAGRRRPTGSCRRAKACERCRTSSSWAWASRSTISATSARRFRS
jgi:hypothetical protein